MVNYIKSELYRILRSKGSYLFVGICAGLLLASNIVLAFCKVADSNFSYAHSLFAFSNVIYSLSFVFILCMPVASLIFANEHNNRTMKNTVSYGITRGTIYFSKLIVEIISALMAFIIIIGVYVASTYLLLENSGSGELLNLLKASFTALPLFLFALATTNGFYFICKATGTANMCTVGLLMGLPVITSFLGMKFAFFNTVSQYLPWNMVNNIGLTPDALNLTLSWEGNAGYYNYWIFGILQFAIIAIIGYVVFRKKEIK